MTKECLLSKDINKRLTETNPWRVNFLVTEMRSKFEERDFKKNGGEGRYYEGYGKEEMETLYSPVLETGQEHLLELHRRKPGLSNHSSLHLRGLSATHSSPTEHFIWGYTGQCLGDSMTSSPIDKHRPRVLIFSPEQKMGLLYYLGGDGAEPIPLDQRRNKWNHFVTV